MTENDQENFFASDSLKGILEKDDLIQSTIESQIKSGKETILVGKFVKLSLNELTFTVSSDNKMAKILLGNPHITFLFEYMDETWLLSSKSLMIESKKEGQLHLTLAIMGRR